MTCVPACDATTHGFELLATIDGTDTKFGCNVADLLYSWVGTAAMGGFLGLNVATFVSAVISGAAGTYVLTLVEDADVSTDLTIQPGQNVQIFGKPGQALRWGSGFFTVMERVVLSLTNLRLTHTNRIVFEGDASAITLASLQLSAELLNAILVTMLATPRTMLHLNDVSDRSGIISMGDRRGGTSSDGMPLFVVVSGPCTPSETGRCVGRSYNDPSLITTGHNSYTGQLEHETWHFDTHAGETCEIRVLAGGTLGPCPVFDTVSYPRKSDVTSRHDTVGLGKANCQDFAAQTGQPDRQQPAGCYTGTGSPAQQTPLVAGDNVTWNAGYDSDLAFTGPPNYPQFSHGNPNNRASAHSGWALCFA
jgi:hypothetical protein